MWNFFKSKATQVSLEKKSSIFPASWLVNGGGYSNNDITIRRALRYYDNAAPVATAIDWINDEFKTLSLVIQHDKEITTQSKILDFLKQPNDDMTQEDFLEALGAYYLITNEVYIIATGNVMREPAELIVISPEYVQVRRGLDGFIGQINVQSPGMGLEIFTRADNSSRFYNKTMDKEIWQIKGFAALGDGYGANNDLTGNGIIATRGRSKLSSIHREINQYIEIAQHNLSTLDNGLLPSGTITMPDGVSLTDDQFEAIRTQIVNYYSGAKNAGKVLILDNGMLFTPMGISPKDMDFEKLTRQVTITIFNRYKVPLPLISPDNMTLANMETAKVSLYQNCVIPVASRLLHEITLFIGEKFKLTPQDNIVGNWGEVSALQTLRDTQLKLKSQLNCYSPNEIRMMDGAKESAQEGMDKVLAPWTLVPIGTPPAPQTVTDSAPNKPTVKQYREILQKQLSVKGERIYSDRDIEMLIYKQGL